MTSAGGAPLLLPADLGPGARGGFTTRAGGVSGGPYAGGRAGGLNLGRHVGDDPSAVLANRGRLAAAVGAPVAWMDQVHGARVRVLDGPPRPGSVSVGECDALVAAGRAGADRPAAEGDGRVPVAADGGPVPVAADGPVPVAVLVADCVPVLIADAHGRGVAAVHVGRQGLVRGVLAAALAELAARGIAAGDLYAAVGPSICGRCYEVPAALRREVDALVPGTAATTSWGTPALDLPAGALRQLGEAGVARISHLAACTLEDDRFYSYRRAARDTGSAATGRFAGVVMARRPDVAVPRTHAAGAPR
ncbi:polyphenol oxidase family protein [Georgenia sp. SYP-B2076]|uniref:polyphenol oxidase family protein n=1 Tax=Georgenia sp. SYP-B2076 TaxID=2495881 RepID=UPI000F8EA3AC|nr:polyphenol oxidase family protein [Georgenia sp. SYP-B2076]